MSLKKRNRRVQLQLGREDLARRHAAAYLAGERSWLFTSFAARRIARQMKAGRAGQPR
jgi:hypothetical protein